MNAKLLSFVAVVALTMCALGGVVILSDKSDAALGTYTGGENRSSFDNPYTGINVPDMLTNLKSATPEVDGDTTYYEIDIYIEAGSDVYIGKNITALEWGYFDSHNLHLDEDTLTLSGTIVDEGSHADDYMDPILTWRDQATRSIYSFSVCIVETPEMDLGFESPDSVEGLSGDSFSYRAATNIPATFSEAGGSGASWLSVSGSGLVTGTLPNVSSPTSYTYIISAVSQSDSSNTARQTITIEVYPWVRITPSSDSITGTAGQAITPITLSCNLDVTYSITSSVLPDGLVLSGSKISGTPIEAGSGYFYVRGSVTEGPSQAESIRIDYDFEPAEPTLQVSLSEPNASYTVGESVSLSITSNIEDCDYSVSGTAADWMSVSGTDVVGSVPAEFVKVTEVTLTVTAESPKGQIASDTVTFNVEPVIQFTTVPTVSCIISPVYDESEPLVSGFSLLTEVYADDSLSYNFPDTLTISATFTGENAETVTWYWGDGSSDVGNKVQHTYAESGTYTILLVASNDLGDSEMEITVTVGESTFSLLYLGAIVVLLVVVVYLVYRLVRGGDRRRRL